MLEIRGKQFYLDGKPFTIISGALHYVRIHPAYWEDRIIKLKACGMNTIEIYSFWNTHEPRENQYVFDGQSDVVKFLELCKKHGMYVILRSSPYGCGEWEAGGFPSYLFKDKNMKYRCSYPGFLNKLERYMDVYLQKIKHMQYQFGGPIIATQIENEYGAYGNDVEYMQSMERVLYRNGIDVLHFTSDNANGFMLKGGTLPNVYKTVNFGSHAKESLQEQINVQPDMPLFVMEFWFGWFDHWGKQNLHHTRETHEVVSEAETVLKMGGNINFYMAHGGTNFGFNNGANCANKDFSDYSPVTTSYDYDAFITEDGELTDKYFEIQKLIKKYFPETKEYPLPAALKKKAYGKVILEERVSLFNTLENMSNHIPSNYPLTMEEIDQLNGYILYRTDYPKYDRWPGGKARFLMDEPRFYVDLYKDQKLDATIWREKLNEEFEVKFEKDIHTFDFLFENTGRIHTGPHVLKNRVGMEGLWVNGQKHFRKWKIYPLPMDENQMKKVDFTKGFDGDNTPAFHRGYFEVDEVGDTFLDFAKLNKGNVWINGFALGKYWSVGPQMRLYVPAPILKKGKNEIIIFEHYSTNDKLEVEFKDKHELGPIKRAEYWKPGQEKAADQIKKD